MISLKFWRQILTIGLLAGVSATASAQMLLNGAGATFPYPIYSKWFDEYAKVDPSVRFNYQSIGSGGGQKQILAQTVDFGASDGPMSDDNLAKAPGKILHIPTVAGADVVAYNLPGNPALKFDADTIAGVFLGQIKKWNDPKITALNPGVKLPDQEIVVVHRSDGSGTTYIWTDYLSKISPEWKSKVGTNTSVNWPTGIGGKGNEGVAGQIKQTPGALGYVELIYAIQNKMPYAEVKNSAGERVEPSATAGSGSYDGMVGLAYSRFLTSRITVDTSGQYTIRSEADNFKLGDRIDGGLALAYRFTEDIQRFPQFSAFAEANVRYLFKSEEDGERDENTGGTVLFLTPGVRVGFTKNLSLTASSPLPVVRSQLSSCTTLDFSPRIFFANPGRPAAGTL